MWEGSLEGGANAFVTGLFNVIWCVHIRVYATPPPERLALQVLHRVLERKLCARGGARPRADDQARGAARDDLRHDRVHVRERGLLRRRGQGGDRWERPDRGRAVLRQAVGRQRRAGARAFSNELFIY